MKRLTKKALRELEIETTKDGFVVWAVEEMGSGVIRRHWILDGSMLKSDGIINMGESAQYKINAVYDDRDNSIIIKTK